jgi:tRNA(fMet)-specific endonuclease VapC
VTGHPRGILDTSTVILLTKLNDHANLPEAAEITAVTLAELSVGPLVAATQRERAGRQAHLQQAEATFDPLPFDRDAARAYGRIAAELRSAGRKPSIGSLDAMIAAIALANDLPLYTANPQDFGGITGLAVVEVPIPD